MFTSNLGIVKDIFIAGATAVKDGLLLKADKKCVLDRNSSFYHRRSRNAVLFHGYMEPFSEMGDTEERLTANVRIYLWATTEDARFSKLF